MSSFNKINYHWNCFVCAFLFSLVLFFSLKLAASAKLRLLFCSRTQPQWHKQLFRFLFIDCIALSHCHFPFHSSTYCEHTQQKNIQTLCCTNFEVYYQFFIIFILIMSVLFCLLFFSLPKTNGSTVTFVQCSTLFVSIWLYLVVNKNFWRYNRICGSCERAVHNTQHTFRMYVQWKQIKRIIQIGERLRFKFNNVKKVWKRPNR